MKRNHIFISVLFGLTAFFPTVFLWWKLFLPSYKLIWHGAEIFAAAVALLMAALCIAMLCFRDKRIGKPFMLLLCATTVLLPLSRWALMLMLFEEYSLFASLPALICYGLLLVIVMVTMCIYVREEAVRILTLLIGIPTALAVSFVIIMHGIWAYQEIQVIRTVDSSDGIYTAEVLSYLDGDSISEKGVVIYDRAQSFSVGCYEFRKNYNWVTEINDETAKVKWLENNTLSVGKNIYDTDGEKISQPTIYELPL